VKKNPAEARFIDHLRTRTSKAELGADVNGLAVLLGRIGQRGEAVAFLLVPHAGGDIEVACQAIAAADVDRLRSCGIAGARRAAGEFALLELDARGEAAFVRPCSRAGAERGEVGYRLARQLDVDHRRLREALIAARNAEVVAGRGDSQRAR